MPRPPKEPRLHQCNVILELSTCNWPSSNGRVACNIFLVHDLGHGLHKMRCDRGWKTSENCCSPLFTSNPNCCPLSALRSRLYQCHCACLHTVHFVGCTVLCFNDMKPLQDHLDFDRDDFRAISQAAPESSDSLVGRSLVPLQCINSWFRSRRNLVRGISGTMCHELSQLRLLFFADLDHLAA